MATEPSEPPKKKTGLIVGIGALAVIVIVALIALASGGGGNGGSGTSMFKDGRFAGHGVSFDYPNSWSGDPNPTLQAQTGNKLWNVAVGSGRNIVIVAAYTLQVQVSSSNLPQLEPQLKGALAGMAQQVGGSMQGDLTPITVAGFPGLQGTITETLDGAPYTLDTTFVFNGSTEYQIACQYDAAAASDVTAGCTQVVGSFQVS